MTPGPSANTFVDLLREPSDDLQAQIKKNLDVVWQTTAIHTIVSDVDFWTRTLYYDTTNHDKEPQEQLKTLTKIFHHLRTSTIECKDENDGSTDYWTDFFQKVSSHFQTVDVHAWVRQLYDQNGAIQCNNDNVSTGVVNGDCLRDKLVRMVERADTVGVERINGQALQAALPCESGQLKDKLLTTKPNQQARTMSIVDGYETLSSNAIKSKQGKPVERDRFIGNVNTDDTAQTEPAGNRGIVDNPAKGVAVWEKLVGTDRGVNGAVKDCATDVNSCDSEYDVGVTMKGGAIGGELVEDNGGPAEHESAEHESAERESVKGEPNGRVPTTNGVGGNSAVEDQPANDARILGDAVNDDIGSKSFGSERIVDAAAGVNEIPRAKTQTKEDGCLQSQITRMTLTKSRPLKGRLSDVDPIETNKLDLVGSTKACITNVFDSQSGPVKESNTKKYGKPNGIVESSADGSVDDGICAQSEPAEATLWQSKLIEMPTELNIEHNSVEPRPMEETGVCKALQLKSLCSSAQDRGSIQIELAEQGMAKKDPATMKPVGSDQREKLHLMSRTLPSIEKANVKPDPLATKQPAIFSRETSPMPHKQDTLSVQGMEAGNSAGSYIPLPSRIRQLMLFRWPGNEEYGQYVVVMFKIQLVVGTVLFGFLGMLLYFACCG